MDCNWIKIYDAAVGGNELDPSNLYDGLTVYVDISEIPSGTEFVGWKDLNGHLLNDSVIKLVEGGRYETTISCGNGFSAYYRTETEDACVVIVEVPDSSQGYVTRSEGYDECDGTTKIAVTPNCCYEFTSWSDQGEDNTDREREVPVTQGTNTYTANFTPKYIWITATTNNPNWGTAICDIGTEPCRTGTGNGGGTRTGSDDGGDSGRGGHGGRTGDSGSGGNDNNTTIYVQTGGRTGNGRSEPDNLCPRTTLTCGETFTLTANPAPGYVFDHWDPDGNTDAERTLEYHCGDPTVYKAIFREARDREAGKLYHLTFDENYNGGQLLDGGMYHQFDPVTSPTVYRNGYRLLGWSITPMPDPTPYTPDPDPSTYTPTDVMFTYPLQGDMTFYAVWHALRICYIHYFENPRDMSTMSYSDTVMEGACQNLRRVNGNPYGIDYYFAGWRVYTSPQTTQQASDPIYTSYKMTTYAVYAYSVFFYDPYLIANQSATSIPFNIILFRYIASNGTSQSTYFQTSTGTYLKSPTDLGFEYRNRGFIGWSDGQNTYSPGDYYSPIWHGATMSSVTSVSAIWSNTDPLTISYHSGRGMYAVLTATAYYGDTVTLNDGSSYSITDYTFIGWSSNPDATFPEYTPGQIIVVMGDMTLYGVWRSDRVFTLTYHDNTTSAGRLNGPYNSGDFVTVGRCNTIEEKCWCNTQRTMLEDCPCKGWNTKEDGTGDFIPNDSGMLVSVVMDKNIDLFPVYDCCFMTFSTTDPESMLEMDGVTIQWDEPVDLKDDVTFDVIPGPSRCFRGWFNLDTWMYLQPCQTSNDFEYLLVPEDVDGKIPQFRITRLNDAEFVSELTDKQLASINRPFIMNTDTGEIRQWVSVCQNEEYEMDCGMHLLAIITKNTYEEDSGTGWCSMVDPTNYNSFYEYIATNPGDNLTDGACIMMNIQGSNRRYIVTGCPQPPTPPAETTPVDFSMIWDNAQSVHDAASHLSGTSMMLVNSANGTQTCSDIYQAVSLTSPSYIMTAQQITDAENGGCLSTATIINDADVSYDSHTGIYETKTWTKTYEVGESIDVIAATSGSTRLVGFNVKEPNGNEYSSASNELSEVAPRVLVGQSPLKITAVYEALPAYVQYAMAWYGSTSETDTHYALRDRALIFYVNTDDPNTCQNDFNDVINDPNHFAPTYSSNCIVTKFPIVSDSDIEYDNDFGMFVTRWDLKPIQEFPVGTHLKATYAVSDNTVKLKAYKVMFPDGTIHPNYNSPYYNLTLQPGTTKVLIIYDSVT